jgi:hypothetical protein
MRAPTLAEKLLFVCMYAGIKNNNNMVYAVMLFYTFVTSMRMSHGHSDTFEDDDEASAKCIVCHSMAGARG